MEYALFIERLPYEYAEDQSDKAQETALIKSMNWFVAQADPQFWHVEPTEDGTQIKIWNSPPSENSQERIEQLEKHTQMSRYLRLALWAQKSLEGDQLECNVTLEEALAEAQKFDSENILEDGQNYYQEINREAAVAGTAYALARFAESDLWDETTATWTFDTLLCAAAFRNFSDLTYRGTILSRHPLIFSVYGLSALLARGYEIKKCQSALLNLALSPLESVAEAVATSAKHYSTEYPEFYYVLFDLFMQQCIVERNALPNYNTPYWNEAETARNLILLETAEATLNNRSVPHFPTVPLPWLEQENRSSAETPDTFGFTRNSHCFQWNLAERTILRAHFDTMLVTPQRHLQFMALVEQLVAMTIQDIIPPYAKSNRDHHENTPFEWVFSFFHWFGKVASRLSATEVERIALKPLLATDNKAALLAMQSFAPSYLAHSILSPVVITNDAFATWKKIADWIILNPEGKIQGEHVDREFSLCVFILLFCYSDGFRPLDCVVEEGWEPLNRFKPIIEKVVRKFGTNPHLFLGIIRFFKKGGLDFIPEPGLSWLCEITLAKKKDQDFWRKNGDETIEILKLTLSKKAAILSAAHRESISFITDILVDNGI
ncbi:hypothetical protein, partial [Nitrosomonas sp.]|uniref:hypothetical protein n=1 Tax=Nitrosomonas sp. TaxID=42353 RepID=UPI00284FB6A5